MGIRKDIRDEMRLSRESHQDLRAFIREINERSEKTHSSLISEFESGRQVLVDLQGEIADQRRQIQANTEAVLSVLDRLD